MEVGKALLTLTAGLRSSSSSSRGKAKAPAAISEEQECLHSHSKNTPAAKTGCGVKVSVCSAGGKRAAAPEQGHDCSFSSSSSSGFSLLSRRRSEKGDGGSSSSSSDTKQSPKSNADALLPLLRLPPVETFEEMGADAEMLASLRLMLPPNAPFVPSPVQQHVVPQILAGRDVLACAPTGSGKTLAFLIPLVVSLMKHQRKQVLASQPADDLSSDHCAKTSGGHASFITMRPRGCIIAPTAELAEQTARIARLLSPRRWRIAVLTGGHGGQLASGEVTARPDILIATPLCLVRAVAAARAASKQSSAKQVDDSKPEPEPEPEPATKDNRNRKRKRYDIEKCEFGVRLDQTCTLILDEIDKLLDLGLRKQANSILKDAFASANCPQLGMFSATLDSGVEALASNALRAGDTNSVRVTIGLRSTATLNVEQRLVFAGNDCGRTGRGTPGGRVKKIKTDDDDDNADAEMHASAGAGAGSSKFALLRQQLRSGEVPLPVIIFVQSASRARALCAALCDEFQDSMHSNNSKSKENVDANEDKGEDEDENEDEDEDDDVTDKNNAENQNSVVVQVHGERSARQRARAVRAFRSGRAWALVATDVLERGVDLPAARAVVNFDVPTSRAAYVHRVGRAGRHSAGPRGVSVTYFTTADSIYLRMLAAAMRDSGGTVPEWLNAYMDKDIETRNAEKKLPEQRMLRNLLQRRPNIQARRELRMRNPNLLQQRTRRRKQNSSASKETVAATTKSSAHSCTQ